MSALDLYELPTPEQARAVPDYELCSLLAAHGLLEIDRLRHESGNRQRQASAKAFLINYLQRLADPKAVTTIHDEQKLEDSLMQFDPKAVHLMHSILALSFEEERFH